MGHYPTPLVVGALLRNRPHIILTFAPTAALLGFSILQVWTVYSILLSMMHKEIGVEMTRCCSPTHWLQLNTSVKSVLRRQPCRSAVLRSGKQWLLLTCWSFCRQREHEMTWSCPYFSHCPVFVCVCLRWSTPHLEARLKGCTSTIWSWVWCFWPEDAMRRRPSVSCFSGVHRESVLMLFCWSYVVWRTYKDHKKRLQISL